MEPQTELTKLATMVDMIAAVVFRRGSILRDLKCSKILTVIIVLIDGKIYPFSGKDLLIIKLVDN